MHAAERGVIFFSLIMHITAQIIKIVMSSAADAKLATLYIVAKECVYIRLILEEMGHRQPATPLQTNNATAAGVINRKIQPKRTKAMNMCFHGLWDRETLLQFCIYWRSRKLNLVDYFTKHHPASHHRSVQGIFFNKTGNTRHYKGTQLMKQENSTRTTVSIQSL